MVRLNRVFVCVNQENGKKEREIRGCGRSERSYITMNQYVPHVSLNDIWKSPACSAALNSSLVNFLVLTLIPTSANMLTISCSTDDRTSLGFS